jgi:formylglycine-generating enzyme required for sulfatase activity
MPYLWGLYDMLGNVREWCSDGPVEYTDELAVNPIGPTEPDAVRVLRAGSWRNDARSVSCTGRRAIQRSDFIGLRPGRVQQPQNQKPPASL